MPGAAATVVVGSRLPASAATIAGPAFVLTPADTGPSVSIVSIDAPRETPFASRAPVQARVRVRGAAGRRVAVQLRQGQAVLDRAERTVASADEIVSLSLDFVPVSRGASVVSVSAAMTDDARARADADVAIDVVERAWRVLFYDRRPSWASTFVRRALERDPRFSVRSRTQTSTGLAVERGEVPSTLRDEDQLEGFDAVVVGAPAVLTPGDVQSLEAFARYRGGAVVVLLDEPVTGALAGLTGATSWTSSTTPTPTVVESAIPDQPRLEATEVLSAVPRAGWRTSVGPRGDCRRASASRLRSANRRRARHRQRPGRCVALSRRAGHVGVRHVLARHPGHGLRRLSGLVDRRASRRAARARRSHDCALHDSSGGNQSACDRHGHPPRHDYRSRACRAAIGGA